MKARTYIATFNALDPGFDPIALKRFLRSSDAFEHWWNHLPYIYLLTSTRSAEEISELLRQHANDASFLVMAVDPTASDGRLPERSWQWIKQREHIDDEAVAASNNS